jgi:hypothetical protein
MQKPTKLKVPARSLQVGDAVGSGEIVASVTTALRTPRGNVEVMLEKNGRRRLSFWGADTLINVTRISEREVQS